MRKNALLLLKDYVNLPKNMIKLEPAAVIELIGNPPILDVEEKIAKNIGSDYDKSRHSSKISTPRKSKHTRDKNEIEVAEKPAKRIKRKTSEVIVRETKGRRTRSSA